MKIVKDKYRGTKEYDLVKSELINAAQYRGFTTYQYIAMIMNLPLKGNHMQREVGQMLGEIAEDEFLHHRPLLSAVCVDVNGKPGKGFFSISALLDLFSLGSDIAVFWTKELKAVYDVWKKPIFSTAK